MSAAPGVSQAVDPGSISTGRSLFTPAASGALSADAKSRPPSGHCPIRVIWGAEGGGGGLSGACVGPAAGVPVDTCQRQRRRSGLGCLPCPGTTRRDCCCCRNMGRNIRCSRCGGEIMRNWAIPLPQRVLLPTRTSRCSIMNADCCQFFLFQGCDRGMTVSS